MPIDAARDIVFVYRVASYLRKFLKSNTLTLSLDSLKLYLLNKSGFPWLAGKENSPGS